MKKIRVVQLGTAHAHALGALITLREMEDIYEVVAIGEPDAARREKLADDPYYTGLTVCSVEEALAFPDLDAAVIEVEEKDLCRYALMAAERGLHIQMDKPGGESYAEFEAMIRAIRTRNLIFQPGYMYRFNPALQKAFELVDSGVLGDIFSVEAQMSIDMGEGGNRSLSRFSGGMMFFLGCHLADVVYRICGKPREVHPMHCSVGGFDVNNYGMTTYVYPNGISFIKTCAAEVNGFIRRQIAITGTLGSIEIKPIELFQPENTAYLDTNLRLTLKKDNPHANFDGSTKMTFPSYRRYDGMFLQFAKLIRGEAEPFYTYEQELELFRLVLESSDMPID